MARNILIRTALLLCCYSPAAAQVAGCVAIPDAAKISEVGAFSNVRYTDEHAYGYLVMLWRAGDCLFGFFESSQGLAGDTPIGGLQDLKYDSKTGHLSFSAKLTTGVVSFKGSSGFEPSRDLFAFDGNLKGNTVTGVITYTLQNNPHSTSTHTNVVLGISKTEADVMHGSTTHGEWLRKWQPILQRLGPQW
ncbi:MAG TPA: hypothetical protein VKI41_07690 [Vicinamibacteria bacterium]|nr:hypothetical protein [Vicinamibacteria bacterium]